jgi:5-methylcytosine-specific restriction endonuclease McrA
VQDITSEMRKAHRLSSDLFKRPYKSFEEIKKMPTRRHYLIRQRGHRCEMCLNEKWLNKKIPLELDHIDGNKNNNSLQNLRLLRPNCHAFTDTYKGKNLRKQGK